MTRKIVYVCDVCDAEGPPSYAGGGWENERLPNPRKPGQKWLGVDTQYMKGVYHVCSEACYQKMVEDNPQVVFTKIEP